MAAACAMSAGQAPSRRVPRRNIVQRGRHPNLFRKSATQPRGSAEPSRNLSAGAICDPDIDTQHSKKPLEEKGGNVVFLPFSSQDEKLVHKSISKKHTNRYLTSTNHSTSAMLGELPSRSARAVFHGIHLWVESHPRAYAATHGICIPAEPAT